MEGWKEWIGKKVYIETRSHRKYSGKVIKIDAQEYPFLVWITLIDKFDKKITFVHSEINLIQEEKNGGF